MICNCGGLDHEHFIGVTKCFRKKVLNIPRKKSCEQDMWVVEGQTITGTTLREQRMYYQHENGEWSCPKDECSENSIRG
jgi:hypothetical protein